MIDVNEQTKREIKDILVSFDRSLIAAGRRAVFLFLMGRSSSLRAQEVRWSFCSCPLPEVLPINAISGVFIVVIETMEVLSICCVCFWKKPTCTYSMTNYFTLARDMPMAFDILNNRKGLLSLRNGVGLFRKPLVDYRDESKHKELHLHRFSADKPSLP